MESKLSDEVVANFVKLEMRLRQDLPPGHEFDMLYFSAVKNIRPGHWTTTEPLRGEDPVPPVHECGTIHCSMGMGPFAGVEPLPGENWREYGTRAFAAPFNSQVWKWAFEGDWEEVDNSKEGAADRVKYLIEHRAPPPNFEGMNLEDFPKGWESGESNGQ